MRKRRTERWIQKGKRRKIDTESKKQRNRKRKKQRKRDTDIKEVEEEKLGEGVKSGQFGNYNGFQSNARKLIRDLHKKIKLDFKPNYLLGQDIF